MVISRCIKPPWKNDIKLLNRIGAILDYYSQKYRNITITGDFNIKPWHDTQAIAQACAVTHENQEKGGLDRRWKTRPKGKFSHLAI